MIIERGDIILVDLEPVKGSEQGRIRPCLVVQNNTANYHSPNTIIVPITTTIPDKEYPNNVFISSEESGLDNDSLVLCSQIRTISIKNRVIRKLSHLENNTMNKINSALKISLGLE
jgi:mRNA interferase MazF